MELLYNINLVLQGNAVAVRVMTLAISRFVSQTLFISSLTAFSQIQHSLCPFFYASVNSSSAHAPQANTRALAFFFTKWQIPWGGDK